MNQLAFFIFSISESEFKTLLTNLFIKIPSRFKHNKEFCFLLSKYYIYIYFLNRNKRHYFIYEPKYILDNNNWHKWAKILFLDIGNVIY